MELVRVVTSEVVQTPGIQGGGTVKETVWTYEPKGEVDA